MARRTKRSGRGATAEQLERRLLLSVIPVGHSSFYNFGNYYSVRAVATADLRGDGKTDIIAAESNVNGGASAAGRVTVLLGNGDGTFEQLPPIPIPGGLASNPQAIALADLNGDNIPDLVVANDPSANTVTVLLGNGDGTFGPPQTFAVNYPGAITLADVTGDGTMDIVAADSGYSRTQAGNTVSILPGNGDGTFGAAIPIAVGNYPVSVTTADLSGDGKPDILTANLNDSSVSVLVNNGGGVFANQKVYSVGYLDNSVVTGDFRGDGKPDIVVNSAGDQTVRVLLNNGDGTFGAPTIISAGYGTAILATTDFTGDGLDDVVMATNTVRVLVSNGDGMFHAVSGTPFNFDLGSLAVGEFTGDHLPDVAAIANVNSRFFSTGLMGVLLNGTTFADFTNGDQATFRTGVEGAFPISTTGTMIPKLTEYGSLPYGLKVEDDGNGGGELVGTPASGTGGAYSIALIGTTSQGAPAEQSFTLTVDQSVAITSASHATLKTDATFSFTFKTTGFPTAGLTETGALPAGVTFQDNGDGTATLAGVPLDNANGTYVLTLNAQNGDTPNASQAFTLTVQQVLPKGAALFGNAIVTNVGNAPASGFVYAALVADLRGDGIQDIITLNNAPGYAGGYATVRVLLGNGNGTFHPAEVLPIGGCYPGNLTVGDFNGDGQMDIAVTARVPLGDYTSTYAVVVFLADGNGTFKPPEVVAVPNSVAAMAAGDFTGNGRDDLAVVENGQLAILASNSNGTFQLQQNVSGFSGNVQQLAAGDLNGDHEADIVTLDSDGRMAVLFANGAAGIQAAQYYSLMSNTTYGIGIADFNGDGKPDIFATYNNPPTGVTLGIFLNNGDGTFQPTIDTALAAPGAHAITGDFDGDGKTDLVVSYGVGDVNSSSLLPGNGDGTFGTPIPAPHSERYFSATAAAGDFNGDGKDDLAIGEPGGSVDVLLSNGAGTFKPRQVVSSPYYVGAVAVGNINGDGKLDVAVANSNAGTVTILLGNGKGGFTALPPLVFDAVSNGPDAVALADVNGDGKLDLVVACGNYGIDVLMGNGNGTFKAPVVYLPETSLAADSYPVVYAVKLADVNGDGRPDLIAVAYGNRTNVLEVLLNNRNGTFALAQEYEGLSGSRSALAVGDFNGGRQFEVVTGSPLSAYSVMSNGYFGSVSRLGVYAGNVLSAGLTGDGIPDLVSVTQPYTTAYSGIAVVIGNRNGTFAPPINTPLDSAATYASVAAGVFTGDGKVDLAVENPDGTLAILLGNGNGTFGAQEHFRIGNSALTLNAADFNGDSRADILASGNGALTVLLNETLAFVAPRISSANHATFVVGKSGTLTITTTGFPVASLTETGNLPEWLSFADSGLGTATIAGTPPANTIGTYVLTLTAANGVAANAIQVFTLTVIPIVVPPGDVVLGKPVNIPAGNSPDLPTGYFETVADVNGDGKPDIILGDQAQPNSPAGSIRVLLNNGNGTFKPAVVTPTFNSPGAIAVGDFSGDGRMDIALLQSAGAYGSGGHEIQVLLGNANGTFKAEAPISLPYYQIVGIAAADISGDGKTDLVLAGPRTGVMLGNGNGTFKAFDTIGNYNSSSVVAADFNGDHKADIALLEGNQVAILFGNGNGTFKPGHFYSLAGNQNELMAADFNGDGKPDLVAGYQDYMVSPPSNVGQIAVFLNNGNGTFALAKTTIAANDVSATTAADLTGNGHASLIVDSGTYNRTVTVLLGNGDGTFAAPAVAATLDHCTSGIAAADFSGDGRRDIAAVGKAGIVELAVGNGNGTFKAAQVVSEPNAVNSIITLDVNGDQHPDLITATSVGDTVRVLLGNGTGAFTALAPIVLSEVSDSSESIAAGDLNGDGSQDLVVAAGHQGVDLLIGNGDGTFKSAVSYAMPNQEDAALAVAVADINGDHKPDIIVATRYGVEVLLNNGNGTFAPARAAYSGPNSSSFVAESVAVGDFTGDGVMDIVASGQNLGGADGADVFLGNGDGTFKAPEAIGGAIGFLATAQLTGDGNTDLVLSSAYSGYTAVFLGNGDGTFKPGMKVGNGSGFVNVADLNGDGKQDLVTITEGGVFAPNYSVSFSAGNGDGTFKPAQVLAVGNGPVCVAEADFNGDGKPDIAAANYRDGTVSLLLTPPAVVPTTPKFTSVNHVAFTAGTSGSFAVTTSASPVATLTATPPVGLTFTDNGDGTASLSGQPGSGTGGTYSFTITASNGAAKSGTQVFTLTVDQKPAFSSAPRISVAMGTAVSFSVMTTGFPSAAITELGALPAGMVLRDNHNGTATILGKPTAGSGGLYQFYLLANNGIGTRAVQTYTLDVLQPPAFTTAAKATFVAGTTGSFAVKTTGFPAAALSEVGAPAGIGLIDNGDGTGVLGGAATTGGVYTVSLIATNGAGPAVKQTFTLTVDQAAVIGSANSAAFSVGVAGTFTISASGFPAASILESGVLPKGLVFRSAGNGTATIAGLPAAGTAKSYAIVLIATNGVGTKATQSFTLTVS